MENNKIMIGAPKMNGLTYSTIEHDSTIANVPSTSLRKELISEYDAGIPTSLADIYTLKSVTSNSRELEELEQKPKSKLNKATDWYNIISGATGGLLSYVIADLTTSAYKSDTGQSIIEKALETNIRSTEGDLARKELRTLQSIEFLKDYETKKLLLSEAIANNDEETIQSITEYLESNAQTYELVIKTNGRIAPLYYDIDKDHSLLRLDTEKVPLWDRLMLTLTTMFDNKADTYEEAVKAGYGDAVLNVKPKESVWNNPDRTDIISNLDKIYNDNITSQLIKLLKINDKKDRLRNGGWFFDPDLIDPVFREKVNSNQFEWGKLSTYPYAVPLLGSSLGEVAATVLTATLGRLVSAAAKKAATRGNPYSAALMAIGEAGLNAANSYYQRSQETNAEVFDAYLNTIVNLVDEGNVNVEGVLEQGIQKLKDRGVNTDDLTVPLILEEMLVYNIKTDDPNFERIKLNAFNGLDNVWTSNMALGVWDALDMALYSYGGKLAVKSAKESLKSGGKALAKAVGLTKVANIANDIIDTRLNKALYKIAGRDAFKANKYRDVFNTATRMSAKLGVTAFSEGTEEGQQYLIQKDYEMQLKYDPVKLNLVDAFLKNFKYGTEANLALMGLHPDDALNNDQELELNMKIGALIGLMMGGTGTLIADGNQLIRDVKSNDILRNMAAYDISNKEEDVKVDRWYDAVKKGYTMDVMKNLLDIRDRFLPEGLTLEDIDLDIKKAAEIQRLYDNNYVEPNLNTLRIKKGTEDHKVFVKNAVRAIDVERAYNELAKKIHTDLTNKINSIYTSDEFENRINQYWDSLNQEEKASWSNDVSYIKETVRNAQLTFFTLDALTKLKRLLNDMSKFINQAKKNGLDVSDENIAAVVYNINKKQRELQKIAKQDKSMRGALAEAFGTNTDPELELLIADSYIITGLLLKAVNRRSVYETGMLTAESANPVIDFNIKNWQQLNEDERAAVKDRITEEAKRNGKAELSDKAIVTIYNNEVAQRVATRDTSVEEARNRANEIIRLDMQRYTLNDRSYEESQVNLDTDALGRAAEEVAQEEVDEDFTPTGTGDNSGSLIGLKDPIIVEDDVYTETDLDKLTGVKETAEEDEMDITSLVSTADEADADTEPSSSIEDILADTESRIDNTKTKPDDATETKITLENMMDASNFVDPGDNDGGLTSDDNPFLNPNTYEEPILPSAVLEAVTEEPQDLPYIDPNLLLNTVEKAFPEAEDFFVDSKGRMFLHGKEITQEELDKERAAEEYANNPDETLTEKANKLEKDKGNVPGLSSSTSILNSWLVGKTLFYKPDATVPMNLPFKIKGMKTLHSGYELGIAMGDPDFLSNAKIYFVPGPTLNKEDKAFDPNDVTTYDNASIYMIIDKLGEVYAAAYRGNRKAYEDYLKRLGRIDEGSRALEDLSTLSKLKEKIVRYYLEKCEVDPTTGKYILPQEALTHVVPTVVNVSNGIFNNIKSGNKPVFRKLRECKTFQIPEDPKKILEECTFGYGVGGIQVGYKADPYAIKQLGSDEVIARSGGFAGKLMIFPKPSQTPRGRNTLPVYLSEKFFRDDTILKPSDIKLRSHDENGNPTPDAQYSNFMEYVLDLIVDGDPYGILPLIINHGERTRLSDKKQEQALHLAKKLIGYDPDTDIFYIATPHKDRGGLYFRTNIPLKLVKTNPLIRTAIIWHMMQDFHWNTDKNVLTSALPNSLRDLAIRVLKPGDLKLVLFPGELEFTLAELGISEKNGKLVKDTIAPPALAWAVNSGKLMTDMGDYAFKNGFIYAEDVTIDQSLNVIPTPKLVRRTDKTQQVPSQNKKLVSEVAEAPTTEPTNTVKPELVELKDAVKKQNRSDRRLKAIDLAKALLQPDSNAPKVNRYMTSEEIEEYAASLNLKPALSNFVYVYDLEGNPKMLIKSMLEKVFNDINETPTFYVTGMYSTEDNEVSRLSEDLLSAKRWIMDKLGLDVDQVMVFNGVMRAASNGPRVYGVTRLAANGIGNIILGLGAGKGILYHEAWHYVNLLLHSPRERLLVYEDFIKHNPEYRNATINEVEEAMAEDFRSWAVILNAKWYKLGYQAIKLFRAIKEFVRSMLNIPDSLHSIVYKGINKGNYSQYRMNPLSVEEFNKSFTLNGTFFTIPGVPDERLKNMPSIINPDVFYDVLDSLTSTILSVFNIRLASDVYKLTENLDYLPLIIEGNMDMGLSPEENEQLIQEVLDNWDIFKKEIAELLSVLNIKATEIEDNSSDGEFKNGEKDPSERYDRVAFEFSKKLNMSFNAKLFFYSIPKVEYNKDKELVPIVDPIFGLNMTESFDVTWNKIMENLWDIERWEDLENRCNRLGNSDPFFKSLYNYISGANKPDENTCTQILTTIKSAKNEMTTIEFTEAFEKANRKIQSEDLVLDVKNLIKAKAGKWLILDSSLLRLQNKYPKLWGKLFYVSGMIDKSVPGDFKINEDKLTDFTIDFDLIKEDINTAAQPFLSKRPSTDKLTDEDIRTIAIEVKEDLVNWLNSVGIDVDTRSIDYLLYGMESVNNKLPTVENFDKLYTLLNDSSRGNIRNLIIGNLDRLKEGETNMLKLDNPFPVSDGSFILKLAIAHGKSHPNPSEFSVTGPNNTTVYPITLNNYMSDRIRWFNKDASEVAKTKAATYNKHSRLLSALEDGSKLSLSTFIAVRNGENRDSRDYFLISPIEDYIAKMVLAHNDRITLPTMADKKTWYSISGVNMFHDMLSRTKRVDTINLYGVAEQIYVDDDMYSYSTPTLEAFMGYMLDEFNAIEDYYANKSLVEQNPNLAIDNYHGKIKNGRMDNSGNGAYFRYFSSLKMKQEDGSFKYIPLNLLLWSWSKFDYDNGKNLMPTRLKLLKQRLFGNPEELMESINATLLDKVEEELEFLENKGMITRNADGSYSNILLPKDILDEYGKKSKQLPAGDSSKRNKSAELYSLVANHVVNQASSIIELEKAFVGDPAYYKWKRDGKQPWIIVERSIDKIKRLGSVLSTGDNLRTYWGDGDPRNNSKFTVLHMSDNNVESIKFDEYKRMFTATEVMKHIERVNPGIDQSRLVNMVSKENIDKTIKSLNPKVRLSIDASVNRLIAAYGITEDGRGRINQADAAVYIRPALYKRIVQAVGEWSPEVERAFELLESEDQSWLSDPKLYSLAIETLIKPLKMVYFGNHELTKLGLNVPVFDKMAIFPMFRVLAKADNYHIYLRMNNEELGTIDMLTFESAVKVGGRKKFKPYKDALNNQFNLEDLDKPSTSIVNGETNLEGLDTDNSKLPTYILDLRNLRLLMNTDPHEHTDRSLGTQFAKIALSNLIKTRPYGRNKGVEYTGRLIVDNIFSSINRLTDLGVDKIYNEFTDDGALSTTKLSNFLVRQAKDSGLSRDVVSSFEIDPSTGQMRVPLSALSNRRFIESRVISQVGKAAIDINTPGGSAIQHAFFGFKKTTEIVDQDRVGRAFNDGKDLSPLNSDGSMDCMLSTNFFRHVVPAKVQKQGYTAIRDWLLEKNIIGQDAKPYALGYRIPTLGLSSTASLKVTDVLPESMGDVIVVPNDFTAMTGSDFDIDKLYITTGYYDKEGNYLLCDWNDIDSNSEQLLVNGLIDMYRISISDDTNIDLTKAPLDNLTEKVKEQILPLVMGKSKNEAKPMYELLPSYLLFKKFEYTGGKDGIAPFALASTNHALTLAMNLRMDLGSLAEIYDLGNINDVNSLDGERILDWLSAMINAHVDVAKDPYIINLNVNSVTYGMTEFLLRTGKGEATFYFLSQPILKDFANQIIKLNGQYGVDPGDTSYSLLIDNTIASLKRTYIAEAEEYINTLPENQRKELTDTLNNIRTEDDKTNRGDGLNVNKLKAALTDNINGNRNFDFYLQLILVANTYLDLSTSAERLTKLVRLSLIDTKKYGNTLALQSNFYKNVSDFITNEGDMFYLVDDMGNTIEGNNSLLNYYNNSFLMRKLNAAIELPRFILHRDLIQATDMYGNIFNNTINLLLGERMNVNKLLAMKLDSVIDSIIRGRIADNIPDMHLNEGELQDMVMGTRTVPKRLHQLKYAIYRNREGRYDRLLNLDGSISNAFLNYLIPTLATNTDEGGIDTMMLLNSSMSNSSNFENRLIAYFSDLMSSEDQAIKQFANRLALYAYYTSYDNKGPNTFSHLISSQFRIDSGYAKDILTAISDMNTGEGVDAVIDEYMDNPSLGVFPSIALSAARNNAYDSELVKNITIPKSGKFNSLAFIHGIAPWNENGTYLMSFSTKSRTDERDFLSIDYPLYGNRNTVLYVKVGRIEAHDTSKNKKLGLATLTVYAAVPRLGLKEGATTINEYNKLAYDKSDFTQNNIDVLSWKYINDFFGNLSKYKMLVKGVNSKNIDITFIPSLYFTEGFNPYGMDQLTPTDPVNPSTEVNEGINKEINDEQPTQLSNRAKSKAIETKELDPLLAAEVGLLDKGNIMNKVRQQLLMTEATLELGDYSDPTAGVESSGEDISGMFTTMDDLSENNFSDEAFKICKD